MKPHDFEKNTEEFLKPLTKAQLSDTSKMRMREILSQYADFHSLKTSVDAEPGVIARGKASTSPYERFFGKMPVNFIAGIMIALVVGGGTSYAAESALPGDTLYPIKIGVNEKLSGALALSTLGEARHESTLAERRLTETEKLAAKGSLDASFESELRTEAKLHRDRSLVLLSDVEAEDTTVATDIRTDLEARLLAHGGIMAVLGGETAIAADTMTMTAMSMSAESAPAMAKSNANLAFDAGAGADAEVNTKVTKEAAIALVRNAEGVYEKAHAKMSGAEAEVKTYVDARLNVAALALADAKTSLDAEVYASAYASAEESLLIAKEVLYFLSAAPELLIKLKVGTRIEPDTHSKANYMRSDDSNEEMHDADEDTHAHVEGETTVDISNDMIDTQIDVERGLDLQLQ